MQRLSRWRALALVAFILGAAVVAASAETYLRRRAHKLLVAQVTSEDEALARAAYDELNARGWLFDPRIEQPMWYLNLPGVDLRGLTISGQDLRNADLEVADLSGAYLGGTNMQGVDLGGARGLTDASLAQLGGLREATMPDGSRYDGRYVLPVDEQEAISADVDVGDASAMAGWYGVSLAEYEQGRAWAQANLEQARAEGSQAAPPVQARAEPGALAVLAAVPLAVILAAFGLARPGRDAG